MEWRDKYLEASKNICMKCKPRNTKEVSETDKKPVHCCYPGQIEECLKEQLKKNNPRIDFDHKNPITITVTRPDGREYRETRYACPAYEQGFFKSSICLVNDYKPGTCLGFYCEKWDNTDKEILVKGRFEEKSINWLKKHVKVLAQMPRKYFIITENPESLCLKLFNEQNSKIDFNKVFVDTKKIFTQLIELRILDDKRMIITNTPLEELLSSDNLEEDWASIKSLLLRRYTYLVSE